jgi:hypothetical protein
LFFAFPSSPTQSQQIKANYRQFFALGDRVSGPQTTNLPADIGARVNNPQRARSVQSMLRNSCPTDYAPTQFGAVLIGAQLRVTLAIFDCKFCFGPFNWSFDWIQCVLVELQKV